MNIQTKLFMLCGTGLLALGSLVSVVHFSLTSVGEATVAMTTTSSALRNHLEGDMMHDAVNSDVLAARLAKTEEESAQVRKDLDEHATWFRRCLEENAQLDLPTDVREALADAKPRLDAYINAAERIVKNKQFDEASLTAFGEAFGQLEEANEKLSDLIERSVTRAGEEQTGTRERANTKALLFAGIGAAGFGAFSFWIARSIGSSLAALRGTLSRFAKGDLSERAVTTAKDEVSLVALEANTMADSMSKMVEEIRMASEQVAAAAHEIDASGQEVRRQTDEQAARIEQLGAAMTQMSQVTEVVATRSQEASQTAADSGRAASEGGEVVNEALTGMKTIDATVSTSASLVQDLGKRGEQIGQIIKVIDDIAEQTNLLALNAAIEAARAGEHGRGFAVVADEVRKLADRTTKATEEVGRSISAIREQTKCAVEQMGTGTARVRDGVARAQTARERLDEIVSGTNHVSSMIGNIAAAAEEQRSSTQSVLDGIGELTASARAVKEGATESAQAASMLAEHAGRMRDLVNRFTLKTEPRNR
ncbi:MAG: HAMP domain-containing methyl-accepting chemotaxis protein [Phycisphaerales bacterium]